MRILFQLAWLAAIAAISGCGLDRYPRSQLPYPSDVQVQPTRDIPGVVALHGANLCTGIIIHPRLVLTAAHCLKSNVLPNVLTARGRFPAVEKKLLGPGDKEDTRDIGTLLFSEEVAPMDVVLQLGDSIRIGDQVRLIGYGCHGRYTGTNVVYRVAEYIELLAAGQAPTSRRISGPENRASTCPGDSGGPLLKETSEGLRVVGVLHSEIRDRHDRYSAYINVTSGETRKFIEDQLRAIP